MLLHYRPDDCPLVRNCRTSLDHSDDYFSFSLYSVQSFPTTGVSDLVVGFGAGRAHNVFSMMSKGHLPLFLLEVV